MQHQTAVREQGLIARKQLLEPEKKRAHRGDELAQQPKNLPWVGVAGDSVR